MWLRKIKRKKLQFALIAVILFFAAAILSGCLIFSVDSSIYINDYYSREKNFDAYSYITSKDQTKKLEDEASKDSGITKTYLMDGIMIPNTYELNGKVITAFFTIFSKIDNYKELPWDTSVYKGKDKLCPEDNEIWVSKIYAENNNIRIGDTITVNNSELTISAIVKCSLSPSSTMSVTPFFINNTTYKQLTKDFTYAGLFAVSSNVSEDYAYEFVKKAMGENNSDLFFVYKLSALSTSVISGAVAIGGIGFLAAIMIFIVSIVIIKFIINNNLIKEYRYIGIHKALGDSNQKIRGFYMKAYTFVSLLAVIIGSLSGIILAYYMSKILLDNIGDFHFSIYAVIIIFISILFLMLILIYNLLRNFRKINKITPVNAIRDGITSSKNKLNRSLIKNAYRSISMAINDIMKHKGTSIMMVTMLTISFFLSLLFVNINYSAEKIPEQSNKWFAIPKTDATVSGKLDAKAISYIENSPYVKSSVKGMLMTLFQLDYDKKIYDIDLSDAATVLYDDWSYEITKIPFDKGRPPANENELALSKGLLADSNLKVGDYIDLSINHVKNTFLITGEFSALLNGGLTIAFHTDIYKLLPNDKLSYSYIYVNLKNNKNYQAFKNDIQTNLDEVSVDRIVPEIDTAAKSIVDLSSPISKILVVVFILFGLINIINLLALENLNNRKQFGILKSLGFSNNYICLKCFWKIIILTLISIITSLGIYLPFSRALFKAAVGIDSMLTSIPISIILIVLIIAATIGVTMLFCIPLRKVSPKDLMEE